MPSLSLHIQKIKTSAFKDAQAELDKLPSYIESLGPYKEEIQDTEVAVTVKRLYQGNEGFTRSYYFPEFILRFAYANNTAEGKLKDVEQQILSTLRFLEQK